MHVTFYKISIHFLYIEEDATAGLQSVTVRIFQSTSSTQRKTLFVSISWLPNFISIHFLYTEEDNANRLIRRHIKISIHFLYTEEDDIAASLSPVALAISIHFLYTEEDLYFLP